MTEIIMYAIAVLALISIVWLFYVAAMSLKDKWGTLPIEAKVLGGAWVIVGYLLDVCLNIIMSPIFLEPPFELTLSSRLKRHREKSSGYRLRIADYICENLLNPFEKAHC